MFNRSNDLLEESAYLVERGVRAMSIVDHIEADPNMMIQASSRLEIASSGADVVPFVVDREDGVADCGYAAARWVVDLYEWIVRSDMPPEHVHRVRGLLLGYSPKEIRAHDERGSGRRFTWSPEPGSSQPTSCMSDRAEIPRPCCGRPACLHS